MNKGMPVFKCVFVEYRR